MSFINFNEVTREYKVGSGVIKALDSINFEIEKGEFAVILGPSGSGKSTMLNLLGGMDRATSGSIYVDNKDVAKFSENDLTTYRRHDIGFVFQFYNLMPNLTAKENIQLARQVGLSPLSIEETIDAVGLKERTNHFPSEMSGGEQQRVSIARALCKNPKLLLCDEPTGALDSDTGKKILVLLQKMSREFGHTVIIVTHNSAIAAAADRIIHLKNGHVLKIDINTSPLLMEEVSW